MLQPTVSGLTKDQTIPLAKMLSNHGFVNVTGLREYVFGFIPTRTVGKNMLAKHLNSYAIVNIPENMKVEHKTHDSWEWETRLDPILVFIIVVTNDSKVWIGKPSTQMIDALRPHDTRTDLSSIDIRLTQFADHSKQRQFTNIVRPHRLRSLDLLSRASPIFK